MLLQRVHFFDERDDAVVTGVQDKQGENCRCGNSPKCNAALIVERDFLCTLQTLRRHEIVGTDPLVLGQRRERNWWKLLECDDQ